MNSKLLWALCGAVTLAIVTAISFMFLTAAPAQAQYPCSGPGPGERMVGVSPGGHGVAPVPLCVRDYWPEQQQQQYQQYQPPIKLPDQFAAFAADYDGGGLFWSVFYPTGEEAEQTAMSACQGSGAKNCGNLGWFSNQCGAIAVNGDGKIFKGFGSGTYSAGGDAISKCNAGTTGSTWCTLKSLPICVTYDYGSDSTSGAKLRNDRAKSATQLDVESFTAQVDKREYWGAVSQKGDQLAWALVHKTKESAMQEAARLCGGAGCSPLVQFENSCVAWARVDTKQGNELDNRYYTFDNPEPAIAYTRAIEKCHANTGMGCNAYSPVCSGRRYLHYKWDTATAPTVQKPAPGVSVPSGYWEKTWGGYAQSFDGKKFGFTHGALSKEASEIAAVAECHKAGGRNCRAAFSFFNQCSVAVKGKRQLEFFGAGSVEDATSYAMSECAKDKNLGKCKVLQSGCTEPIFNKY